MNKYFCIAIVVASFLGCSVNDRQHYQSLADSLNSQCPIKALDGETEVTQVACTANKFQIIITLNNEAPISVSALKALNEEYIRLIQEAEEYGETCGVTDREIGGKAFLKGLMTQSSTFMQIVDTIALATSTPESTQGWIPLDIYICDETDTLVYTYNSEWASLTEHEWLNAIMPIEMCKWTSERSALPPLNEVIAVNGIPHVNQDGLLRIYCSYDADPAYTHSGKPMCIDEIKGKYFSKKILEDYLADRMAESKDICRYLNACSRRGIGIQFIVDGFKDGIDYDLSTPEFIKKWESWGGSDSIVILNLAQR